MYNNDFDQTKRPVSDKPVFCAPYIAYRDSPLLVKRSGVGKEAKGFLLILAAMFLFFGGFYFGSEISEAIGLLMVGLSFPAGIVGLIIFFLGRFS